MRLPLLLSDYFNIIEELRFYAQLSLIKVYNLRTWKTGFRNLGRETRKLAILLL